MDAWEKLEALEHKFFSTEQQLLAAARALPEPLFVIDEFGKYLEVIGGLERSPFCNVEFLAGKYLHDILPEQLADRFMQTISEAIADKTLKILEYELGPGDIVGSPPETATAKKWFECRVYPIKDRAQKVHSVIAASINITNRKRLELQLQEISERDTLTGAYNRKYFMQIFGQEFHIARRYKTKLSVLLLDIDNLKEINSSFGYDGGDAVLKSCTSFCMETLRDSDLFARYSTEKFIIMLPNTPSIGAAILAERLRAGIEDMAMTYHGRDIGCTASVGISLVMEGDTNSSAVISRAESALYQAKKKGRNRVEII